MKQNKNNLSVHVDLTLQLAERTNTSKYSGATVIGVCPVTSGLPGCTPAPSVSGVVPSGKTPILPTGDGERAQWR